ncbi:DNA-binding transcriptional regulator, LysR family [Cupriavidus necator]|uniref:LysR family transcriptional regulator n=1 Tax=Cupriavidus necator (strain ATCC 17699 / DSM 428 / KCTC 22496 / NCIMB 10442 / H16 / Stanier 337) TaxID=381666 RepID=Q0JY76_CUPNH|nr:MULTISPECIES: LysR substrate-binding domain-containing protein [Cupriavidus]EON20119.1 LysR family transcriptional regulator [Cupriavidus sp. GA3-3]QCC05059.1 LysR family transcriptional regulator [Cupriavidus necator H16]QQB79747.1 LysR family transcriptional regulator [Cupriavidus necator]WKA43992.1 LysR substrate-binding domain-containing protein [Cupriavidus necator]CAJ97298.1 transcriptional regulator, LysR-family [Cupriavidus necator H16]
MRKLPPLGALRTFEAAARRASFKHAADELHVTPTAVSHQIRLLEESLGVKLFERQTRKVRLTPAGHQLFPAVRDGLDGMERAVLAVQRSAQANVATLTSTVAFMARRLAPRAGQFRTAYPDWTLRLDASDQVVDLDHDADAAIRYGSGSYPGLVVEPLFCDRFAPVCSPGLKLASVQDLKHATLVHFEWGAGARDDERAPVWHQWLAHAGVEVTDPQAGLSFTDEIHAVQATIAGQGVGLLSLTLVAEELASGVLVQPFGLTLESFRYDLVYSERAAERPATRLLRDWVKAVFAG